MSDEADAVTPADVEAALNPKLDYDTRIKAILKKFRLRPPVEVDEFKAREAMRRADKAKKLLEDEDLTKAFEMVEGVYLGAWRMSDQTEVDKRERCHIAVNLLSDLRNYLMACVANGEAARAALEKAVAQL